MDQSVNQVSSVMSEEALCDPTDCSLPGSSVHGFPRQGYCSELPFPTPGDLPDPRIEPPLSFLSPPALAGGFFTTSTTWEAPQPAKPLERES